MDVATSIVLAAIGLFKFVLMSCYSWTSFSWTTKLYETSKKDKRLHRFEYCIPRKFAKRPGPRPVSSYFGLPLSTTPQLNPLSHLYGGYSYRMIIRPVQLNNSINFNRIYFYCSERRETTEIRNKAGFLGC